VSFWWTSGFPAALSFWWTFGFQAVNFIALVVILYFVLYKPVRKTMKAREEQIQGRYDEAEQKTKDAEKAREDAEATHREIDAQRTQVLDEAKQAAAERGEALLAEARKEADRLVERTRDAIRREWTQAADGLSEALGQTVIALCAKVLESGGDSLTERAVGEVVERIGKLEGADLDEARRGAEHGRATVRAAGALSDQARQQLAKSLGEKLGRDAVELDMQEDASLVAGIEVALGTLRVRSHWRQRLDEALEASRKEILEAAPAAAADKAEATEGKPDAEQADGDES
jgi:F-type H+-transporting ATPase subunit b